MEKNIEAEMSLTEYTRTISEYTILINKILLRKPQTKQPHKFTYTLSFKTNSSLDAANLLMENLLNKPSYTDALFLILRTIMSDAVTYYYLLYKSNKKDEAFIENIKWLDAQHIIYTLQNASVFQAGYNKEKDIIEQMKNELKLNYKDYFNEDGEILYRRMKGISGMVNEMANSNKVLNSFAIRAYGLYDVFSKYEHLGILTSDLVHRQFNTKNRRRIFGEIYEAVREIIYFQRSLLNGVIKDKQEIDAFEMLSDKIVAMKIYEHFEDV